MKMLTFQPLFIYLMPILALVVIGLATFLKNRRNIINILFFLLMIVIASWLSLLMTADLILDTSTSLWLLRGAAFVGTLMIPLLLYFSVYFPVLRKKPGLIFHIMVIAPAVLFMGLAFTPWLLPAVKIVENSAQPTELGLLYSLQTGYALAGFLGSFGLLLNKLRGVKPVERSQIYFVIIGLLVALTVNLLTGYFLALAETASILTNMAGSLSFLVLAGFVSYSIIKHRMFDVRMAIARTLGFVFTIFVVGGIYSLLVLSIGIPGLSSGRLTFERNIYQILLLVPPTIFVGFTFHSVQNAIARATKRIFYQDDYDLQAALDSLSDKLVASNDIENLISSSMKAISQAIKPSHSTFAVFSDEGALLHTYNDHTDPHKPYRELLMAIKGLDVKLFVRDQLPDEKVPEDLIRNDTYLALILGDKNKQRGMVLFGPKQNGMVYSAKDINMLRISAKNLGIALENAIKNEQITRFADTMREEVKSATASLRKANRDLKTLDGLKDDFISMASHQLKSPATSVHEALQMYNGTDLKISKTDKQKLIELAEASSERLVAVVTDMLSIARIQAGHFDVNKASLVFQELVDRSIKQARVLAEQKNIKLIVQAPKDPLVVFADQSKLTEAITNYIENAIKYSSEKTKVKINIRQEKDRVIYEVTDEGMGVPEAERGHLFEKFYRANNARIEQPDGNGIGLFVVKTIAEAHGGEAYYQPLEKGSLFGFWLPSNATS